jgi:predicted ribosome quality control (RQC) complex YloA/Tae2 family protein
MPKKSISSLELTALVNELQFIVKGKVSQIYHQEKKELLLQLHAPGQGKQILKIIPGKFLCLIDEKQDAPLRPTGFCMQLRKYLGNAFIKNISQHNSERIVVFEFEKKERFYLIIELFSKGNIILTDKNYLIIATLEWHKWKDRTIKPKEIYQFPKQGVNWKKITKKELLTILNKSEKKNLATSLATEVGLGGVYAEETCTRSNIDKNILPTEVSKEQVGLMIAVLQEFLVLIQKPHGFIYEEQMTPFPLAKEKEKEKIATYNEAISRINPFQVISPYDKRIKSLEKTIDTQETAIKNQEDNIDFNTKIGELIYNNYSPLQKLLDIVKEMKKEMDWIEIAEELKKEKKISKINLKKKTIIINL